MQVHASVPLLLLYILFLLQQVNEKRQQLLLLDFPVLKWAHILSVFTTRSVLLGFLYRDHILTSINGCSKVCSWKPGVPVAFICLAILWDKDIHLDSITSHCMSHSRGILQKWEIYPFHLVHILLAILW